MYAQERIPTTVTTEYCQPSPGGINNCEIPGNTDGSTPADFLGEYSWWAYVKRCVWYIFSILIDRTAALFSTNNSTDCATLVSIPPQIENLFQPEVAPETILGEWQYHSIICTDATTPLGCNVINKPSNTISSLLVSTSDSLTTIRNNNPVVNCSHSLDPFSVFLSELDQDDATDVLYDNQLTPTTISAQPTSHTLLTTCYVDALRGLIDNETRDQFVEQILASVIPRNLSDSSDSFVKPHIRKMYAWTKPENLFPAELENDFGEKSKSVGLASTGDDTATLNTSCTSFSPLSPGTEVSTTPTGDFCRTPNAYSDIQLPDLDKHGHTLAWAMSNMQMSTGKYPELPTFENIESMDRVHNGAPSTSSPSSANRPSRDKNTVSTINSSKRSDAMSLPTFTPIEESQFVNSLYDCEVNMSKPKRSSSLKSQRSPPGTPKAVRFADAFGLDLATVKHVFDLEFPPRIPASATFDLDLDTDDSIAKLGAKQFGLLFAQPGSAPNFVHRVFSQTVCLEDAHVDMPRGVLTGTVRIRSLGFEKRVYARITYNNWMTFFDTLASYVQGSHDGATDRFSFSVVFPDTMKPGDKAQFAIRYEAHNGEQLWDNNHGQNYTVTCYAKATDLAGDGSWVHYL